MRIISLVTEHGLTMSMGQFWVKQKQQPTINHTKKRLAIALIFCLVIFPIALTAHADNRSFFSPFKKVWRFKKNKSAPVVLSTPPTVTSSPNQEPTLVLDSQLPNESFAPDLMSPLVFDMTKTPNLLNVLQAEFAIDRDDPATALTLYKQESNKSNAAAVFERALALSLQLESAQESLSFAKAWQDHNQDHIPVWFFVTHLALKAGDYNTAANNLNMILTYDPNADLRRIFEGILPTDKTALSELLHALEKVNSDGNPSLSALKAGLFAQLGNHQVAVLWANQAILAEPKNLAFLTLKADMLQGTQQFDKLHKFLAIAIKNTTGDTQKHLYLYQIRHLIDNQKLERAWTILKTAHKKFPDDHELTLLAGLVGLDIKAYQEAIVLLHSLTSVTNYADQAHYYLGIAFERQAQMESAIAHFLAVNDPEWLLNAQKKVLTHYLNAGQIKEGFDLLVALRNNHPEFAGDSYGLQADILLSLNQKAQAKALLDEAVDAYPDDAQLLFASSRLLDDEKDYGQKLDNFIRLQQLEPYNPRYQFEQARLILLKNPSDSLALTDVLAVSQLQKEHPDYDPALYHDALVVLARNDLALHNYSAVIGRLSSAYQNNPTLAMGELLLRAYHGLGRHAQVAILLDDLTKRFGNQAPPSTTKPSNDNASVH